MSLPQGTGKSPNQLFNVSISRRTEKSTMSSEGTSVVKMVITSEVISTTPLFCVFDKNLHFSQNSVFLIFSLLLKKNLYFWQNSVFLTKLFVFCGSKNKCSHGGGQVVSTNKAIGVMSAHKGCPPTENSTSPYKCYIFMRTHREDFNIA